MEGTGKLVGRTMTQGEKGIDGKWSTVTKAIKKEFMSKSSSFFCLQIKCINSLSTIVAMSTELKATDSLPDIEELMKL